MADRHALKTAYKECIRLCGEERAARVLARCPTEDGGRCKALADVPDDHVKRLTELFVQAVADHVEPEPKAKRRATLDTIGIWAKFNDRTRIDD